MAILLEKYFTFGCLLVDGGMHSPLEQSFLTFDLLKFVRGYCQSRQSEVLHVSDDGMHSPLEQSFLTFDLLKILRGYCQSRQSEVLHVSGVYSIKQLRKLLLYHKIGKYPDFVYRLTYF